MKYIAHFELPGSGATFDLKVDIPDGVDTHMDTDLELSKLATRLNINYLYLEEAES